MTVTPPRSAPARAPAISVPTAAPNPFLICSTKPITPKTAAEMPRASSTVRVCGSYAAAI
jgi:hypothetical protein